MNLLRKGGNSITRIVSNPCPHSRIVTKDEFAIQEAVEEQRVHAPTRGELRSFF
jgi:hypothetical protein